jgi:undecaprenyl-diphosphatase
MLLFQAMGAGQGSRGVMCLAKLWATWSWAVLLGLLIWRSAGQHQEWLTGAGLLLCAGVLQWIGKRLARRWSATRPFALGVCANHLGHSGRAGFPSSHALSMGVVTGGLLVLDASAALQASALFVLATTAWARVHTGAHFPSDVVVGALVGSSVGALVMT